MNDLRNKVYRPVYFLSGEEDFFIDRISDYIEHQVLDEGEKAFNQTILYGLDTDMVSIIAEAKRFPMMASHTVVIVKEAQNLRKLDALESYLGQPSPTTILVFCYKYKTIDKRKKLGKLLQQQAVYFESKKLYDNQLGPWIEAYVQERKHRIGPKAMAMLQEFLGNNLAKIANELDKVMLAAPNEQEISPVMVEENIGISKDYNIFELTKALGKKDVLTANKIVRYFGQNPKAHPIQMVLPGLYRYFSQLLMYHAVKNQPTNAIASQLGISPYFLKDYQTAAQHYSIKKLARIIEYLRSCDLQSKGIGNSSATGEELMKELVFKVLH